MIIIKLVKISLISLLLGQNVFANVKWSKTTGVLFEDRFESILEAKNGDIVAAGDSGSKAILSRYTIDGKLLWQSSLDESIIRLNGIVEMENSELLVSGLILNSKNPVEWDLVMGLVSSGGTLVKLEKFRLPVSSEMNSGMLSIGNNKYLLYGKRRSDINAESTPLLVTFDSSTKKFELVNVGNEIKGTISNAVLSNEGDIVFSAVKYDKENAESHLFKMDTAFNKKWEVHYPAVGGNYITSLAVSRDNTILVGGHTTLNSHFTSSYISRVTSKGATLWTNSLFNETAHLVNAITEQKNGHIIISTGKYVSGEPGQYGSIFKLTSYGLFEKSYPFHSTKAGETVGCLLMNSMNQLIFAGASWVTEGLYSNDGYVGVMELN